MMNRRVVVTGLGLISPLGNDLASSWAAALEGKSGIARITGFDASEFGCQIAGEVKGFDAGKYLDVKEVRRFDKFVHFGVGAGLMALEDSGLEVTEENAPMIGVAIGIVLTALKTAQYLECAKGHGRGPVGADQRPEIFAAQLKTFEGRLTLFPRLPLQVIEHPASVIADLYAGTQEAAMAHGQTLALGGQGGHQGGLLTGFDVKFDQLSEAATLL